MELQSNGFSVENQKAVTIKYRDITIDANLRLDIIVDNAVILELKSVTEIQPVHTKQLLTYMRLTGIELGYVINFNEALLRDGIERVIDDHHTYSL